MPGKPTLIGHVLFGPETRSYHIGTPFVCDGIIYTSTGASQQHLHELGFQQVIPAAPDDRFYIVNSPYNLTAAGARAHLPRRKRAMTAGDFG